MPEFSQNSLNKLRTCDDRLLALFTEVVKHFDCTIIVGHRGKEDQNRAFAEGKSKLRWPDGNHNKLPSEAVDVAPYPVDWEDRERMHLFAGVVKGLAISMDIPIRWGGDWDGDTQVNDNEFDDLVHFEIND